MIDGRPDQPDAMTATLNEVSLVLWRLRDLLDLLLFKLEEEQLLLAAGRARWLGRATHEVEVVVAEIRNVEVIRAVHVDRLAERLGLPPAPSLRALAEAVDEPWATMLHDHRDAFLVATAEIAGLAESNRELLSSSYRAVRETLTRLVPAEPGTYAPGGALPAAPSVPRLFDRSV